MTELIIINYFVNFVFGINFAILIKIRRVVFEILIFKKLVMTSSERSIVCLYYLLSFLRYSMSKNVVTLESGLKVTQGH